MSQSTLDRPTAPSLKRRRWVALAVLVAVAAGLAGLWWYAEWSAERDFQAALAETDVLDPAWRWDDLQARRAAVPDERNAARVVTQLYALGLGINLGDAVETQIWEQPRNLALDAAQLDAVRKALGPLGQARQEALRLKDLTEGRYPMPSKIDPLAPPLDHVQRMRTVVHFVQYDVLLLSQEGDGAAVGAACRAMLNTSRSVGDEPGLIPLLVRVACLEISAAAIERALAQAELPPDELQALQALVQREIDTPRLLWAMRGERACGMLALDAMREGRVKRSLLLGGGKGWRAWVADWLPGTLTLDQADYLRTLNELVEAAKLPAEKRDDAIERIVNAAERRDGLLASVLGGCRKTAMADARGQARLRCMLAALAAERYRQDRGFWPAALDDLASAGLLAAVPLDPYDGRLLRYRRLPDGVLCYSVGPDRTDNGGAVGSGSPVNPGTDLGVRLWDPAERRRRR